MEEDAEEDEEEQKEEKEKWFSFIQDERATSPL